MKAKCRHRNKKIAEKEKQLSKGRGDENVQNYKEERGKQSRIFHSRFHTA